MIRRPNPEEGDLAGGGEVQGGDGNREDGLEVLAAHELAAGDGEVEVPTFPRELGEEDHHRLRRTLEALLFASTEPLPAARLSEVVGLPVQVVRDELECLGGELVQDRRPYELREHGGGFRLYTREDYYPFLLRLRSLKKVERLTPAALETLAIVAYRQPVIRAEVEAIRGVKVGPMLRALLDRKLVRIVGRADQPGAPLQYGTTQQFLDRFGLKGLADLPSLKEFQQGRI
ncbi:MAG: SMC-Scp complex subunit ScpB [Planctomycetota bacterium]